MSGLDGDVAFAREALTLQETDAMLAELQQMPRVELVMGLIDLLLDCRAAYSANVRATPDHA